MGQHDDIEAYGFNDNGKVFDNGGFSDIGSQFSGDALDDAAPVAKKGIGQKLEDVVFSFIEKIGKKKEQNKEQKKKVFSQEPLQTKRKPIAGDQIEIESTINTIPIPESNLPYGILHALPIRKKSYIETATMQLKDAFAYKASKVFINGIALAVFAIGSFLIYAELPMHPELIIGIILVTIAGNVIISNVR